MSAGAILTLGLGSFGTVNLLPTLGYLSGVSSADTHDGFDPERRRRADREQKERIRRYRRDREHLREVITQAFESRYEPAIEAVRPFVAADAPVAAGSPVDYGALLTAAAALRKLADFEAGALARQREIDDDDQEVMLLL